jgi:hypothetical protein
MWVALTLMFCICIQSAFAMGEVISVTKQTQAKLGLEFTLVAERVDAEAVLVQIEIPKKGKVKDVRSVSLRIGPGRPEVAATLQTRPGQNGSLVASFQVSPALAEKSSVDLVLPIRGRTYEVYAIELKGYVVERK